MQVRDGKASYVIEDERRRRKPPLAWIPWVAVLALLALGLLMWLLLANVTDKNDASGLDLSDNEVAAGSAGADTPASCPTTVNAAELFGRANDLLGCHVDARVQVERVINDSTFTITDGSTAIAVADPSRAAVLTPNERIRLVGTIRRANNQTVVVASSTTPTK